MYLYACLDIEKVDVNYCVSETKYNLINLLELH